VVDAAVRVGGRLAVASVVALLAGAVAPAARTSPTRAGHLRVSGYPYAARCPAAGVADRVDRWRMDMCNCTSYVAWALQANGQRTDWFIPGAMNAWNWPHVAQLAGLRVVRRPRPGAVAVWPRLSPPFGHVAYVTAVDPDGGFDVSEYNFRPAAGARFVFDHRHDVPDSGVAFIDVPRARRSSG
jgi:surface antigen